MNDNPLAAAIRQAYFQNVINLQQKSNEKDNLSLAEAVLRNKRMWHFEQELNKFLTTSGQDAVPAANRTDEKKLLVFALQLSGYIRDAQKELALINNAQACDSGLISLYEAATRYSIACNGKIPDSKYLFREHCDYFLWKVDNKNTLADADFQPVQVVNPRRRSLFLSMPFHINTTQEELQKWSSKFLNQLLDNKQIYGNSVDVYLAHFPIEQPRGEKFSLTLKTIQSPESYYEDIDMRFVKKYFRNFLGNKIEINEQNKICSGEPYDNETFKKNCADITILGYCAGTAHAHRWINAFSYLANQLYDQKTTKEALNNIFVISYAFLPIQENSKYSGIHFMSNYAKDEGRREPFTTMFNPELYEKSKITAAETSYAKVTPMPDRRNHIIAFKLPEDFAIMTEDGRISELENLENGHHMAVVTRPNAHSTQNQPMKLFTTTVENASLGKRDFGLDRLNTDIHKIYLPLLINKSQKTI